MNKEILLSIGILTHPPYYKNYETLIKEVVRQVKEQKETNIEVISIIQIPPTYKDEEIFFSKDYKYHKEIDIVKFVNRNLNPSEARNEILKCSSGKWISFIDGDCLPHENYLSNLVKALTDEHMSKEVGAIQGGILGSNLSTFGKYEYIRDVLSLYVGRNMIYIKNLNTVLEDPIGFQSQFDNQELIRLQGYNCIVPREVYESIGEFNEKIDSAEDRDYAARIIKLGKKIIVKSDILIYHDYNMSLRRILKRKKWHGKGGAYLIKAYPELHPWRAIDQLKYLIGALSPRNPFNKKLLSGIYYFTSTISYMRGVGKELRKLNRAKEA